nr:hypothetical protein [Flavobacteriales bacterium]
MRYIYFPIAVAMLAWTTSADAQSAKPRLAKPDARSITMAPTVHQRALPADMERGGGGLVNDECAGAIQLTVASDCTPVSYSAAGATQSLAAILCNGYTSPQGNDVWFSVSGTGSVVTVEANGSGATFDVVMEAFSGSCGALTSIGCADATFPPNGTLENISFATTQGQTYYVRLYSYWSPVPTDFDFTVCAYTPSGVPSNDLCDAVTPVDLAAGGEVIGVIPRALMSREPGHTGIARLEIVSDM